MLTFKEKVDFVRRDRRYYPWLMGLGISKRTIDEIKNDTNPQSEALISALINCDNVSRSWLLNDAEPPFQVSTVADDDECSEALQFYLEDEHWTAYILSALDQHLMVLTLNAQHARPRRGFVDYTKVKVLPNAGIETLNLANHQATQLLQLTVDPGVLSEIKKGFAGTYRLTAEVLVDAQPVPIATRRAQIFEQKSKNTTHSNEQPINADEAILLHNYRLLTAESKALAQTLLQKLN